MRRRASRDSNAPRATALTLRAVREALRAIGFEEDRGACAVMECAGSFKYQHDTDKDLKFIHVFPKIDTAAAAAAAPQDDEGEAVIKVAGMSLDELPPEHLCAIVSRDTFAKLYSKQCSSFSQRRALLKALKELAARIAGFEERMTNMQALTAAEEELYNTAQDVPEKVAELEKSMEGMMAGMCANPCICLVCMCVGGWCVCARACG